MTLTTLQIDAKTERVMVDLSTPHAVAVVGVDKTGLTKNYLLRVTGSGKLILQ